MMPALVILKPDDAPRLASLQSAAMDTAWPVQDYRKLLQTSTHLGLGAIHEADDTLLAFALCQVAGGAADLLMIATHPKQRRRGYAKSLLRALLRRLGERGIDRLTLDVSAKNLDAIALYEGFGFVEDGRRANYYKPADGIADAVLMSRSVAGLS